MANMRHSDAMTGRQFQALRRRGNKYGARRTKLDGVSYDSRQEACRAAELAAESAAGQIRGYLRQVTFRLGCEENRYRADFVVFGPDGIAWAEDVKGFETPAFLEVRRLWARYGPCPLIILKRGGKGWRREEVGSEKYEVEK